MTEKNMTAAGSGFAESVDDLFADWNGADRPGAVVAVIKGGEVVHRRGYGMANIEHGIANGPDIAYRIASVSKQFLVTLIMLLAEEGRLALDDEVKAHVPAFRDYGAPITLRHVLSNTSGVRDFLELLDFCGAGMERPVSTDELMGLIFSQRTLNFPPGARLMYCNSGFLIASQITEQISGQDIASLVRQRILEPLGMANTLLARTDRDIVARLASPYLQAADGALSKPLFGVPLSLEGGMISTLDDMVIWARNLANPKVGTAAIFSEMATPAIHTNNARGIYGLGLLGCEYRGLWTICHGGLLPGFRTEILLFPDQDFAVIVIANVDAIDPTAMARGIADIHLSDILAPPPPAIEVTGFADKAGLYHDSESGELFEISVEDGELMGGAYGAKFRLVPQAPGWFTYMHPVVDMRLSFAADGAAIETVISGNKASYRRVSEGWQPGEVEAYVGTYRSDELKADFVIGADEQTLRLQIQGELGRSDFTLEPVLPDLFTAAPQGAQWLAFQPVLLFVRNAEGVVDALVGNGDRTKNLRAAKINL